MSLYIYIIYNCFLIVILHLQQPKKPNKTISVGLVVDYWTAETVININNRHESGTVTKIFDKDKLKMYDQFIIIDCIHVVPYLVTLFVFQVVKVGGQRNVHVLQQMQ